MKETKYRLEHIWFWTNGKESITSQKSEEEFYDIESLYRRLEEDIFEHPPMNDMTLNYWISKIEIEDFTV